MPSEKAAPANAARITDERARCDVVATDASARATSASDTAGMSACRTTDSRTHMGSTASSAVAATPATGPAKRQPITPAASKATVAQNSITPRAAAIDRPSSNQGGSAKSRNAGGCELYTSAKR